MAELRRSEEDAEKHDCSPPTEAEQALVGIADWGPAEDWTDWDDAAP